MQQLLQKDLIVGFIVLLFVFAIHIRGPFGLVSAIEHPSPISQSIPP